MKEILWIPVGSASLLLLLALLVFRSVPIRRLGVVLGASSFLLTLFYHVSDTFTGDGITEATVFHLIYGLDGLDFGVYIVPAMLTAVAIFVLALLIAFLWRKAASVRRKPRMVLLEMTLLCSGGLFSVGVHPSVLQSASIAQALFAQGQAKVLDEEMQVANIEFPTEKKKKSLVYLYVESFERTFLNDLLYKELAPGMKELESRAISFGGIGQAPMTEWTIAGMVASQCGIPLAVFRSQRNDLSDIKAFVPGATCMGDILSASGYHTTYIGGADLQFAGKGNFYESHGFSEIIGLKEIQAEHNNSLPLSKWGVFDDALFETAYSKLVRLASEDEPFALFILTLDTHPPLGHVTPGCEDVIYRDGSSKLLNAVKCADRLVPEFVSKIMELESNHEIVVVVASDHLQMNNDASEELERNQAARENLLLVLNSGMEPQHIRRTATTLDVAPTVLHLLGWEIEKFALGRNLLMQGPTLAEKYGEESFFPMLQQWRLSLWRTWKSSSN